MKGDSQRRQLEKSTEWAKRNEVPLDESLNLRDLGVSAFRGKNAQQGALGLFLEAVETGRVKSGDYLILENLDRLSRDEVFGKALPLVQRIIGAGVNVVSLRTARIYNKQTVREIGPLLEMLIELWLANEESTKKSERLSAAWSNKRKHIATHKLTAICPQWLQPDVHVDPVKDTRTVVGFHPIPERVRIVRRIFRMAVDGKGYIAIGKVLNREGVRTFGHGKRKADLWDRSSIKKLLNNRAVLGEYQPHRMDEGKRVPAGEPTTNYFPPIVSEADFYSAQKSIEERRSQPGGRHGDKVTSLFTGLLKDARDGSNLTIVDKGDGPKLVSAKARIGSGHYISFPYEAFERGLIVWGYDLKLADVLPRKATNLDDELSAAEGRLADLSARITKIKSRLQTGSNLDELIDTLEELAKQRDEARATVGD